MNRGVREIEPELWVVDRPLPLRVGDLGTRMTVIRLSNGHLFLHSPVALDNDLQSALDELGPVCHVVGPSTVHHLFLGDYTFAYPDAVLWGARGLAAKRKDLTFQEELANDSGAHWGDEIVAHVFGGFVVNEVVFFHPATRTLVLTDLAFNVTHQSRNEAKLFHWLVGAKGHFGPHRLIRIGILDRAAARASLEEILDWDFDRVIVTHGDVLESGGKEKMRGAFDYLLGP
ncbi:MAG: DUF4336 domain-containing protein [Acidobacteriota bacterium]|nr:DUF4336 domain-containing protein [Acidobacteriota bacterium]